MKSLRTEITIYYLPPFVIVIIILTAFSSFMINQLNIALDNFQHISVKSESLILNGDRDFYQALDALNNISKTDPKSGEYIEEKSWFEENSNQAHLRINEAVDLIMQLFNDKLSYDQQVMSDINSELKIFNQNFNVWYESAVEYIYDYELKETQNTFPKAEYFDTAREAVNIIGEKIYEISLIKVAEKRDLVEFTIRTQIVFSVIVLFLSVLLAWLFSKIIARPIKEISNEVSIIGSGEFHTPISTDYKYKIKEYDSLMQSLEKTRVMLKSSFDSLSNRKEELERSVEMRIEELVETNSELEASMKELRYTQNALIESRKYESINKLLMEIAHRMNTPLGTLILLTGYLDNLCSSLQNTILSGSITNEYLVASLEKLSDGLNISLSNINISIEIINELTNTTDEIMSTVLEEVDINLALTSIVEHIQKKLIPNLEVVFESKIYDTHYLTTYPGILRNALLEIIKFACEYAKHNDVHLQCRLELYIQDAEVHIAYHDNLELNYSINQKNIFEPYHFSQFDISKNGTQLNRAYRLITQMLSGDIKCCEGRKGFLYFDITLP